MLDKPMQTDQSGPLIYAMSFSFAIFSIYTVQPAAELSRLLCSSFCLSVDWSPAAAAAAVQQHMATDLH